MGLSKAEARSLAKERILGYTTENKTQSSSQVREAIVSYLLEESFMKTTKSKNIALYQADDWELQVDQICGIFPNVRFFFPRVSGEFLEFILPESFEVGSFGIMEPIGSMRLPVESMDLILIPGLGFGNKGHRLGRGKGFYDKALSEVPKERIAGVCFFENAFLDFSWEVHDISVGILFTENGKISFLD